MMKMEKRILVGTESFEEVIRDEYYYVDKTLFIKDFLLQHGSVNQITRPRRFGKTLTMSMLKNFGSKQIPVDIRAVK